MSTQAVAVEQPAPSLGLRRRAAAFEGAWLTSGAMLLSGVLIYAFHVLAARSLGPAGYGQIAVLWAAMFIAAIIFFRPLEQTTSRAIADRMARGEEIRTVLRSVGLLSGAILLVLGAATVLGWTTIGDRLFLGDGVMTAMLLGGIALYGFAYVVRGLLAGAGWFAGYGLGLVADAVARLAIAAPLVFVASQRTAAAAVALAGAAGFLLPLALGRRILGQAVAHGAGARFRFGAALGFAAPASLIAASDQLLVNGGPLFVMVEGGAHASKTAGVVFAATMLVRVPVYVFQGMAASILPNLTHLNAIEDRAQFRRSVLQAAGVLLTTGALIVAGAAIVGPQGIKLLYGSDFAVGRQVLVLLAAGVGFYLAASTLSQALLAVASAGRAAVAWTASAVLFVLLYAVLPGTQLERISLSFAAATLAVLIMLALFLFGRSSR